jgi:hypothetical protein
MSTIQTARRELAELWAPELPDFAIFPNVEALDDIARPTLALVRTRVEPHPDAPRAALLNTFQLYVIVPTNAGEDALDSALEDVLGALATTPNLLWTGADRATWEDTAPAYAITCNSPSSITLTTS